MQAIKTALHRELKLEMQPLDRPLVDCLALETASLRRTIVVILDQFEEFFLRYPIEVRQQFHRALGECLATESLAVHVILSVREDYFPALDEFLETIPTLYHHTMRLEAFTTAQALAAVVEPAQQCGLSVDETLIQDIVLPQLMDREQQTDLPLLPMDHEQRIDLPMLQIVCDALYRQTRETGLTTIGQTAYAAIGDVRTILERYVDDTIHQCGRQQSTARAVLKTLVSSEQTKRAAVISELIPALHNRGVRLDAATLEQEFLSRFREARLIRVGEIEGETQYELMHDYLVAPIAAWKAYKEDGEKVWRRSAQFSPDGTRVATMSLDRMVQVWDVINERLLTSLVEARGRASEVALTPDGTRVATCEVEGSTKIKIWNVVSGSSLHILGTSDCSGTIQFSLDGTRMITYNNESAEVFDVASGDRVASFRELTDVATGYRACVDWVALSPDDARVIIICYKTVSIWDVASRCLLAVLKDHMSAVTMAQFSRDGALVVTVAEDGTAQVSDAASGRLLMSLAGHVAPILAAQFSPDRQCIVTTSQDGAVKLWNVSNVAWATGHLARCVVFGSFVTNALPSSSVQAMVCSVRLCLAPASHCA